MLFNVKYIFKGKINMFVKKIKMEIFLQVFYL